MVNCSLAQGGSTDAIKKAPIGKKKQGINFFFIMPPD